MTKIIINIDMDELTSGVNQVVDDGMYDDEDFERQGPLIQLPLHASISINVFAFL